MTESIERLDILQQLNKIESTIYKEFALESANNIHVLSIDLGKPLISILRVALADIISVQLSSSLRYRILPITLKIKNENNRKAKIQFKSENDIKELLCKDIGKGDLKEVINTFRKSLFENYDYLNSAATSTLDDHFQEPENISSKCTFCIEYISEEFQKIDQRKYSFEVDVEVYQKSNNSYSVIKYDMVTDIIESFLTKILALAIASKRNKEYSEIIKLQSLRSTIAVIMARNQSHTDGSHVMIDFETFFKEKLEYVFKLSSTSFESRKVKALWESFQNYNNHLRNVMELVADVSGGIGNQSHYSFNLNEIYKEFTEKYFSTLYKRKESYKYSDKKFLGGGLTDGERDCVLELNHEFCEMSSDSPNPGEGFYCSNLDKDIAVPGGENGKTALLVFMKNLFRNFYKHSSIKYGINTEEDARHSVGIKVSELQKDDPLREHYYVIDFIELSNSYEPGKSKDIFETLKGHYNSRLIDEAGEIKKDGWGLMEMKICAAYLIGIPLEQFETNLAEHNEKYQLLDNKVYPTQLVQVRTTLGKEIGSLFSGYDYKFQDEECFITQRIHVLKDQFATIWISREQQTELSKEKWSEFKVVFKNKALKLKFEDTADKPDKTSSSSYVLSYPFNDGSNCDKGQKNFNFRYLYDYNFNFKQFFLEGEAGKEKLREDSIEVFKEDLKRNWNEHFLKVIEVSGVKVIDTIKQISDSDTTTLSLENSSKTAFFDNHNLYILKLEKGKKEKFEFLKKTFGYYESNSSKCKTGIYVSETGNKKYRNILLEAINTKIMLLDERLQKYLDNNYEDSGEILTRAQAYELKGVYLPKKDEDTPINLKDLFYPVGNDDVKGKNLPSNNGEEITKQIEDKVYSETEKKTTFEELIAIVNNSFETLKCHYVIIHFSGFESVIKRSETYFKQFKEITCESGKIEKAYELLTNGIKNSGRYLIFTSGKGVPPNLPKACYYTPLNNIQGIIETKTKLDLVTLLNSIRIIEKK